MLTDLTGRPRFINLVDVPDTGSPPGGAPLVDLGAYERFLDCNANGISDSSEVQNGTSDDCNENGVPDECESADDCNDNGTTDICDVAAGTSADGNGDGIPDECGLRVMLDIDPGTCPNRMFPGKGGLIRIAVIGGDSPDLGEIDADSLTLARGDGGGETVWPLSATMADVAAPFAEQPCDCPFYQRDGVADLVLTFAIEEMMTSLDLRGLPRGRPIMLTLGGCLQDGTRLYGSDCVVVVRFSKPQEPGRIPT